MFERALAQMTDLRPEEIHVRCVGELFFEVDRVRLMSAGALERHLENIRLQGMGRKLRKAHQPLDVPEPLRKCFQLFGFTHQIDFDQLKERYRQLALGSWCKIIIPIAPVGLAIQRLEGTSVWI